jgi:CheY-like chemotaxis protein
MRTLLVDDSEVFLRALAPLASAAGLEVVGRATSGEEGCRLHDALQPDLVLVDVQMPDMTGHEVARYVRVVRPDATVVLMSAAAIRDGVIDKHSLTSRTLREAVERGMRARDRARELCEESAALHAQAELQLKRAHR